MKKTLFILVVLALTIGIPISYAEQLDDSDFYGSNTVAEEEAAVVRAAPAAADLDVKEAKAAHNQLEQIDSMKLKSQVVELERRIEDLERLNRVQEDRIRNLDRALTDLKRR